MSLGLILPLALLVVVRAQMPHMPPMPMPMQPPPPYNMYGPVNPYAGGSATSVMYPSAPQQMPPPPMSNPLPYPPGTTMSYSSSAYPIMSAAAPYPTYGVPPPLMYPPPYQTYSGSGPTGDPFTSSSGICKYTGNQYASPIAPLLNGFFFRSNMGMVCSKYS